MQPDGCSKSKMIWLVERLFVKENGFQAHLPKVIITLQVDFKIRRNLNIIWKSNMVCKTFHKKEEKGEEDVKVDELGKSLAFSLEQGSGGFDRWWHDQRRF